jgi:hypothetical protein
VEAGNDIGVGVGVEPGRVRVNGEDAWERAPLGGDEAEAEGKERPSALRAGSPCWACAYWE